MTRTVTTLPVTEKNVGSGNWDSTRSPIDRVIIHTMVGNAASAASRFYDSTSKVSAHYGVLLDGSIWHWVDEDNTAYHSGNYAMNQRSIGIEHEDNGDYNGTRPDVLYTTSARLVKDICTFYGIPIDRQHILKHSEVIATGCPDSLDIERIVREANGTTDQQAILDQCRLDRDRNWNYFTGLCDALGVGANYEAALAEAHKLVGNDDVLVQKDKQIAEATTQITDLKGQVQALTVSHDALQVQYDALQGELSKDSATIADLNKKLTDLQAQIVAPVLSGWKLRLWKFLTGGR